MTGPRTVPLTAGGKPGLCTWWDVHQGMCSERPEALLTYPEWHAVYEDGRAVTNVKFERALCARHLKQLGE